MNKYLIAFLGAFLMLISFSSCTDQEEVDITYHHDVVVEINPLDFIQNTGIDVSKFQTKLGSGFLNCVQILVYNSDGTFKRSILATSSNFNPLSLPLRDLDEKEYTIIVLQYLMDRNIDIQGQDNQFWNVLNHSTINSVRIQSRDYQIPWYYCLGIDTQTINIKVSKKIKATPKLAGSLVSLEYEYLNKGGYNLVGLYFKDKAVGLYLNPQLEGHSKYYYGSYNTSKYWTAVARLSDTDLLYNYDEDSFFFLETGNINCCIGLATKMDEHENGSTDLTLYPSADNYMNFKLGQYYKAFCAYNGDDKKITTYLGLKEDFDKWYEKFVNWIPLKISQPCTKWGCSVSEVKKDMTRDKFVLWYDIQPLESIGGDIYYYLGYYGKLAEDEIQYAFENETGNLLISWEDIWNLTLSEIINQFDSDPNYTRDDEFEELYLEYGCYVYYTDNTRVLIFPNQVDTDGNEYICVQYEPYTIDSQSEEGNKKIRTNRCFTIKKHPKNKYSK